MHLISELLVTNFRSIEDENFHFANYTPLVGYNNAGKSNVLRALAWVCKPYSLTRTDFKEPEKPVTIVAQVTGITEKVLEGLEGIHRTKIEPFIDNDSITFCRCANSPNLSVSKITLEVKDTATGNFISAPTGIPAALAALFPEVISIGAMENAADDVGKSSSTTTIGKLMKEILDTIQNRYQEKIDDALTPIAEKLSASGTLKDETLIQVDERIEKYLSDIFPGVGVKTHIPMPSFDDIFKKATVRVYDSFHIDELEQDVSSLGHGAQRSIQIALVNALADWKSNGSDEGIRTKLLLIDEPELYLHPQAIRMVQHALKSLSSNGYQVAFSTHSGDMVGVDDAKNTLMIYRGPVHGTKARERLSASISKVVTDNFKQAETLFELSNSREFLFSDNVLLCEGISDFRIIPHLYMAIRKRELSSDKIGLIKLDGSGGTRKMIQVLTALGVNVKAVVDFDYAFKEAPSNDLIDPKLPNFVKIKAFISEIAKSNGWNLSSDGCFKKENSADGYMAVATAPDLKEAVSEIRQILQDSGIWLWNCGAIEQVLGMKSKVLSEQLRIIEIIKNASEFDELEEIEELKAFVNFIS